MRQPVTGERKLVNGVRGATGNIRLRVHAVKAQQAVTAVAVRGVRINAPKGDGWCTT